MVHVVQKQTIGAIVIRSARLASVGSMTSNHDDHMLDCNHIYDHNKKHDHDQDDKRCENEGGQSHYFGCQLGAGQSLNLSNVFHPRQVMIVLIMMMMLVVVLMMILMMMLVGGCVDYDDDNYDDDVDAYVDGW